MPAVNVPAALDAFSYLVGAILAASSAFILWNLAARSPLRVITAVVGHSTLKASLAAVVRLIVGLLFIYLALRLTDAAIPLATQNVFTIFAAGVFIAGLAIDALIGDAVRHRIGLSSL